MTTQEAEQAFRRELNAAIEKAWANGVDGDYIAHYMRSLTFDVGRRWNAEIDRRNAQRIEQQRATG